MRISVATSKDEDQINKVLKASFSSLMATKYDEELIASILPKVTRVNPILLKSGSYYIAIDEDRNILGCGGWTHEKPGTNETVHGEAHIRHLSTAPKHIGKGVGKALFEHSKSIAQKEGVNTFICYSTLNAEFFYKSLGFESIKSIDVDMGDGLALPSILMKMKI